MSNICLHISVWFYHFFCYNFSDPSYLNCIDIPYQLLSHSFAFSDRFISLRTPNMFLTRLSYQYRKDGLEKIWPRKSKKKITTILFVFLVFTRRYGGRITSRVIDYQFSHTLHTHSQFDNIFEIFKICLRVTPIFIIIYHVQIRMHPH